MGDLSKNFSRHEFECKGPGGTYHGCEGFVVSQDLLLELQTLRDIVGKPIRITSGYRCKDWNKRVGGAEDSAHLVGEAADIKCDNSKDRHTLVDAAHKIFGRVGIAHLFVHVDVSETKPKPRTWLYPAK